MNKNDNSNHYQFSSKTLLKLIEKRNSSKESKRDEINKNKYKSGEK